MNAIFLLLTLGSVEALRPHTAPPTLALQSVASNAFPAHFFVQQPSVQWPRVDPRDPKRPTSGAVSASSQPRTAQPTSAPAIGRSQFAEDPPNYDESPRPAGRLVAPREAPAERTPPAATRGGNRFRTEELPVEHPRSFDRGFSDPDVSSSFEDERAAPERGFTAPAAFRTSVRKQSGERDVSPTPFQIPIASGSDDPDDAERVAPTYRSFAYNPNDRDYDGFPYGDEPYSEREPFSGRRNEERLASGGPASRDTRPTSAETDQSTLQGGSKVPENASNSMWSFAIVLLLLCASMGANVYLAWVAREFYERYRSLAQQVRAARNNLA